MAGVFYLPSTQSRLVLQETVHKCYYPELEASWKLSPRRDRSRIARTEVQPANHCATELKMHLSVLSPREEVVGIPWGLDCQNSACPQEYEI